MSHAAAARAEAHTDRRKEPKSDPPPRSVPCPVDSDSDGAEVVPEPKKAKDCAAVHSGESEENDSDTLRPLMKKTRKEKTEDGGRKEAASLSFMMEAPRGGSHRISAGATRGDKYKDSAKGNAHLTNWRRMLKKKAGIGLGRLTHHYKQCIDTMEQSVSADRRLELGCAARVVGNVPGETLIRHLKFQGPYCKSVVDATRIIKSWTGHYHENSKSDEDDDFDLVEWAGMHLICGFL